MYDLYIANRNYSSWSLRPWVLMKTLGIAFSEHLVPFEGANNYERFRRFSPAGTVPCLVDDGVAVWDSLAIVEYLAERHPGVWPADPVARAWARCAAAEMHSSFPELRSCCSMTCGQRIRLRERPPALERDIARVGELWNEGLTRFGGPYLAGAAYTAVDAFFAPVVFRGLTYGLDFGGASAAYAGRMLAESAMREWYEAALAETFRDADHEAGIEEFGEVIEDLRAPAR